MSIDRKSFVTGVMMLMGSMLPRKPGGDQEEPVAYLYSGVPLPPLPVNDANILQECPYAIITVEPGGVYRATMLSQRLSVFNVDYPSAGDRWMSSKELGYRYLFDYRDGAWVYVGDGLYASSVSGWASSGLHWTSHDIYYSDSAKVGDLANTLYLSASIPTPIYE